MNDDKVDFITPLILPKEVCGDPIGSCADCRFQKGSQDCIMVDLIKKRTKYTIRYAYVSGYPVVGEKFDMKVLLSDYCNGEACLMSGFLLCNALEHFTKTNPEPFVLQVDGVDKIIYSGVAWGEFNHSCSDEMSACIGTINFNYMKREIKNG